MASHRSFRTRPRGWSLVELMVGSATGLLVIAAATSGVARDVREHQALREEARLVQDLRHAADLVTRDLRRSGHWQDAAAGLQRADGSAGAANPYAFDSVADLADGVRVRYSRDASENGVVDAEERFGFRLRGGVLQLQLGDGNWQALTDAQTLTVTGWRLTPRIEERSLEAWCAVACAPGSATCPPRQQVVRVEVSLTGRSTRDATLQRTVTADARLRHAPVLGQCD